MKCGTISRKAPILLFAVVVVINAVEAGVFQRDSAGNFYLPATNVTIPAITPVCNPEKVQQIPTSEPVVLLQDRFRLFELSCFSYRLQTNLDETTRKARGCPVVPQHKLQLKTEYSATFGGDRGVLPEPIDLHTFWGGSVESWSMAAVNTLVGQLVYQQITNATLCPSILIVSIAGNFDQLISDVVDVPVLVDHVPNAALVGDTVKFTLRAFGRVALKSEDVTIIPVPSHHTCNDSLGYFQEHPGAYESVQVQNETLTFYHTFVELGEYLLCIRTTHMDKDAQFNEFATFQVFGTNPAFYTSSLQVVDNTTKIMTLNFTGSELDADGDSIKLVHRKDTCVLGSPVPFPISPLDAYDGQFPKSKLSTQVTVQSAGVFRVCYKRRYAPSWREIEDFEALPHSLKVTDGTHFKDQCGALPTELEQFKYIVLSIRNDRVPHNMISFLAKQMCIPESYISIMDAEVDDKGREVTIIIRVVCRSFDVCETGLEKMNLLLHKFSLDKTPFHNEYIYNIATSNLLGGDTVDSSDSGDMVIIIGGRTTRGTNDDDEDGQRVVYGIVFVMVVGMVLCIIVGCCYYMRGKNREDVVAMEAVGSGGRPVVQGVIVGGSGGGVRQSEPQSAPAYSSVNNNTTLQLGGTGGGTSSRYGRDADAVGPTTSSGGGGEVDYGDDIEMQPQHRV